MGGQPSAEAELRGLFSEPREAASEGSYEQGRGPEATGSGHEARIERSPFARDSEDFKTEVGLSMWVEVDWKG